jgi:hypothetical protein
MEAVMPKGYGSFFFVHLDPRIDQSWLRHNIHLGSIIIQEFRCCGQESTMFCPDFSILGSTYHYGLCN